MPELYNLLNQTTNEYEFYILRSTNHPKTREEILDTKAIKSLKELEETIKSILETEPENRYGCDNMISMDLINQGFNELPKDISQKIRTICDNLGNKICTLPKGCRVGSYDKKLGIKEVGNGDIIKRMYFKDLNCNQSWFH